MKTINEAVEKIKSVKGIGFIIIGIIAGIALIVIGSLNEPSEKQSNPEDTSKSDSVIISEYTIELEERITRLLSGIGGLGNISVMVSLDGGSEYVYAQNGSSGGSSSTREYVILDNGGQTPVLVKEVNPKIRGIAVVCNNAGAAKKLEIVNLLSTLFNLSANRIYVTDGAA